MTHNSRCASAKFSVCRCSCGGSLHGIGSSRGWNTSSPIISGTARSVAIGAGIGATAVAFPAIVPIYKAYTFAKIGREIYDAYNKSKNKEKTFDKIILKSTKYGASEATKKLSKDEADKISRGIRLAAESAGIIAQISQGTNINEGIYGSMLEGSFKNGMLSGIGNLTTYAIGGLVK